MSVKHVGTTLALAAMLVAAGATPALADRGEHEGGNRKKVSQKFEDMTGFEWGLSDVIRLQLQGIFNGRADQQFAPGATITHQEEAAAAVRLMGKDAEAKAMTSAEADALLRTIPDQGSMAAWARPNVAVLVKAGAVSATEAFAPLEDSSRLYSAELLVKAMGLDAEAQSQMNAQLTFKDASQIPANKVGYVAVAVSHGLVTGYTDGKNTYFRPLESVKRVEMAVMMGRADRQIKRQSAVKGTVKSVNAAANQIVVTMSGRDVTITLSDSAAVFVDKQERTLADITAGMFIDVKLGTDGMALYVEVRIPTRQYDDEDNQDGDHHDGDHQNGGHHDGEGDDHHGGPTPPPTQNQTVTGYTVALTEATATAPAKITVATTVNGQTKLTDYTLESATAITLNGQAALLTSIQPGDAVKITISGGKVTTVAATRTVTTWAAGVVSALQPASGSTAAKVTLTANSSSTVYSLAANAQILVNGQAAQFSGLQVGDNAIVTLTNGAVTKVEVTRAQSSTVTGYAVALTPATVLTPAKITVASTVNGQTQLTDYAMETATVFTLNGQAAQFSSLQVGDSLTLTVSAGKVTVVTATRTVTTWATGTVSALQPVSGSTAARITLTANNTTTVYNLAANAQITVNGQAAQFSGLQVGDTATLTLTNGAATKIEATRAQTATVTGYAVALTPATVLSPARITVASTVNGQTRLTDYTVDAFTVYTLNGQAAQFSSLQAGDSLTLTVSGSNVTSVAATRTVTATASGTLSALQAATGSTAAWLTLTSNNTTTAYNVAANAQVLINGQGAQFSGLQIGDTANLTLTNGTVTKIEVTRPQVVTVNGTVVAMTAASGTAQPQLAVVTLVNNTAEVRTYSIPASAPITVNGQAVQFADLRLNDTVKVSLTNNVVSKVEITR